MAKKKGVAGENKCGYLEARGSLSAGDQQVIQAEIADRRQVYAAIASETGSSADEVGRNRAAQLAELAWPAIGSRARTDPGVGSDRPCA